jgi:lariat debranching enzyme
MRSVYHSRALETYRLLSLNTQESCSDLDIFLSHDWPLGVHAYGDEAKLLKIKPHFAADISRNDLGSPALLEILHGLKPELWFAAHMHVLFPAIIPHNNTNNNVNENGKASKQTTCTRFLALDKVIPGR